MQPRLQLDISTRDLWRILLSPAPGNRPDFSSFNPDRVIIPALSVRTLLDAILTVLQRPAGEAVLMTGFTIENMVDIVRHHGLKPVAVDLDPATLLPAPGDLLAAQKRSGARLCIYVPLYGAVSLLADAQALRERGVILIEDCAQAFAGPYHRGAELADISLFSFGPIKRASALGGGLGCFKDRQLADRVNALLSHYPELGAGWYRRRATKFLLLKALSQPRVYGALIRTMEMLGMDPDAQIGGIARGFYHKDFFQRLRQNPPTALLDQVSRQINRCPAPDERRAICEDMARALPVAHRPPGLKAQSHAWWLFPVLAEYPDRVIAYFRRHGFDATRGATSMRVIDADATPVLAELHSRLFYLPNPADMDETRRQKLKTLIVGFNW